MNLTNHAQVRRQQRGNIPLVHIDWLLDFGEKEKASGGAEIVFLTKEGLHRLERYVGRHGFKGLLRDYPKFPQTYAIVKEGRIITVGYRYKGSHIWRH